MRGVHSVVDEIRRNVFTEVARLAYEGGDLNRVDMIPYKLVPGEIAHYRHDVFLERAVVAARVRLALGMDLAPGKPRSLNTPFLYSSEQKDSKFYPCCITTSVKSVLKIRYSFSVIDRGDVSTTNE